MTHLWIHFETWLKNNWPDGYDDLAEPATQAEIEVLERSINTKLPADIITSLLVHNGQRGNAGGLIDNSELLSTHAILDQWNIWKELLDANTFADARSNPENGIRHDWWNLLWIPLTHNGGGDHYCLDLDPASGGNRGQIITMWHDMAERELKAPSYEDWFKKYVQQVLDGDVVYSEDFGGLIHIDYA